MYIIIVCFRSLVITAIDSVLKITTMHDAINIILIIHLAITLVRFLRQIKLFITEISQWDLKTGIDLGLQKGFSSTLWKLIIHLGWAKHPYYQPVENIKIILFVLITVKNAIFTKTALDKYLRRKIIMRSFKVLTIFHCSIWLFCFHLVGT